MARFRLEGISVYVYVEIIAMCKARVCHLAAFDPSPKQRYIMTVFIINCIVVSLCWNGSYIVKL